MQPLANHSVRTVNLSNRFVSFAMVLEKSSLPHDTVSSVPTNLTVQVITASGRSVFSRKRQDRFAERRSFFVNAAGIRDQQKGLPHQVDERHVAQGFNRPDVGMPARSASYPHG